MESSTMWMRRWKMKLFRRLAKAQSFDVHDEQIRKIIFDEISSLNVRMVG